MALPDIAFIAHPSLLGRERKEFVELSDIMLPWWLTGRFLVQVLL